MADPEQEDVEEEACFNETTAWFSTSVDPSYIEIWRRHGGFVASYPDIASYVFGSDPKADDVAKIFNSMAYSSLGITIFKPCWIDAAIGKDASIRSVGSFILPPDLSKTDLSEMCPLSSSQQKKDMSTSEKEMSDVIKSCQSVVFHFEDESDFESQHAEWKNHLLDEENIALVKAKFLEENPDNNDEMTEQKRRKPGAHKRKLFLQRPLEELPPPKVSHLESSVLATSKDVRHGMCNGNTVSETLDEKEATESNEDNVVASDEDDDVQQEKDSNHASSTTDSCSDVAPRKRSCHCEIM